MHNEPKTPNINKTSIDILKYYILYTGYCITLGTVFIGYCLEVLYFTGYCPYILYFWILSWDTAFHWILSLDTVFHWILFLDTVLHCILSLDTVFLAYFSTVPCLWAGDEALSVRRCRPALPTSRPPPYPDDSSLAAPSVPRFGYRDRCCHREENKYINK